VLTTALDWCLRSPSPFRHKPVGIVGASPSGAGTARGQMVLRQILLHGPAYVMPEHHMMIPNSYERFDENGDLTDEQTRQRADHNRGSYRCSYSGRMSHLWFSRYVKGTLLISVAYLKVKDPPKTPHPDLAPCLKNLSSTISRSPYSHSPRRISSPSGSSSPT
jgi:NADPH-dependent FMN reductase